MKRHRHIVLLRGINVGGHARVPMAELRRVLEAAGHEQVRTHLQSGNVVLDATTASETALTASIEKLLADHFGPIRVVIRTPAEVAAAEHNNPLAAIATNPARSAITFLTTAPAAGRVESLDAAAVAPDLFAVSGREVYLWYPEGQATTKLNLALLERRLGVIGTSRNANTVTKLIELANS